MGKLPAFQKLIFLLLTLILLVNPAKAQMPPRGGNQVAIIGWTDDTHYQIRTFDQDKKPIIQTVDIKTDI